MFGSHVEARSYESVKRKSGHVGAPSSSHASRLGLSLGWQPGRATENCWVRSSKVLPCMSLQEIEGRAVTTV